MTEAGYANGIPDPIQISFDLGFAGVNEPTCVLVQESLAQIGIQTTIDKVPGADWRTKLTKRRCRSMRRMATSCSSTIRRRRIDPSP